MELKLGADNRYHLYSPPKNTMLDARHKKVKPRSLEQLVEEINSRATTKNAEQTHMNQNTVQTGLQQLEKEKDLDAETRKKMMEELLARGRLTPEDREAMFFQSQLRMTYKMLGSLKGCADTIAKYEKLAANESISEEERTFYQESLASLHQNFDKAFAHRVGELSDTKKGGEFLQLILDQVGIKNFKGMDSAQILEKIESAQKSIEGKLTESKFQLNDLSFDAYLSMFEADSTMHLKNADKYGCMPTSWEDCINNPRWKVLKQDFFGTIHLGEKGFWLDTTA